LLLRSPKRISDQMSSAPKPDFESIAKELENSGDYKVLRRLRPGQSLSPSSEAGRRAVFIDLETTGLDHDADEVIEIGLVAFDYDNEGRVTRLLPPYQGFQQPTTPISPEISALTGITDEMVSGKSIDLEEVDSIVKGAALVVAHNAAFDRPFAERLSNTFVRKPWACSMTQVPWQLEGFDGARLTYLVASCGLFHDGHRAVDDCHAAIEVLCRALPRSGEVAFSMLLRNARHKIRRIWANGAPYELRLKLKKRGYRWSTGDGNRPKAWYLDVEDKRVADEIAFLNGLAGNQGIEASVDTITAYDRFSGRV
jgi:DNA polymerase-3 subunit epsilon